MNNPKRPIWDVIAGRMKMLPPEVFERLPEDGASQHDHYIYGLPKRDQCDTFHWIALTNPRDSFHRTVLEFSRSLRPQAIVTTDEVLTELMTFFAADRQLRLALVVNYVLADEHVRVIPQTRRSFLMALALYQVRPDKGYSLTDCISMQTMRREGTTDALTSDRHFGRKVSAH